LLSEARRADSGGMVLGEGQLALSTTYRSTIFLYFEVSGRLILLR